MELLIFNKQHWMDELTQEQIDEYEKKYPGFKQKYDRRYQKGDIVEVREDGYFDKHGFNRKAFAVLKIPNIKPDSRLMETHQDLKDPNNPILLKKRKYKVDMTYLTNKISYIAKEGIETNAARVPLYDKKLKAQITLDKIVGK